MCIHLCVLLGSLNQALHVCYVISPVVCNVAKFCVSDLNIAMAIVYTWCVTPSLVHINSLLMVLPCLKHARMRTGLLLLAW